MSEPTVSLGSAALRLPTLSYTVDSPLGSVRYRAGVLRYAPVAHPGLHVGLSLWTCAIARVLLYASAAKD